MQATSVAYALFGMVAWAFWALFVKLGQRGASPKAVLLVTYGTALLVIGGYALLSPGSISPSSKSVQYSIAGGLFSGLGAVSYYISLRHGDVAVATTVTGLYFAVAAVLGVVVLGESLSTTEVAGLVFAGLGVVLLAQ